MSISCLANAVERHLSRIWGDLHWFWRSPRMRLFNLGLCWVLVSRVWWVELPFFFARLKLVVLPVVPPIGVVSEDQTSSSCYPSVIWKLINQKKPQQGTTTKKSTNPPTNQPTDKTSPHKKTQKASVTCTTQIFCLFCKYQSCYTCARQLWQEKLTF